MEEFLRVDYTLSDVDVFEDDIFANGCNEEAKDGCRARCCCVSSVSKRSLGAA